MATVKFIFWDILDSLVGVPFAMHSSCAVIFSGGEYGLPLESVSSTRMCVGRLTVADVRPGPLTWCRRRRLKLKPDLSL